jgi:hypothetical protein
VTTLSNAANVKTGLPLFELERQAGILYRNDWNDWNRSDSFNPERLERLLHIR